jgi:broad specificity phosphatase PhoE
MLGDLAEDRLVLAADSAFFSSLKAPARFYLVRHGESEANARLVIQGHRDFPLDEAGRRQARAAADWLAAEKVSRIVCSPLSRAAETARVIAAATGAPGPDVDPDLIEIDTGSFSGISLEEAKLRFPREYAAFEGESWEGVPDAERAAALYERAMRVWTRLRARAESGEGAIVAVSHGGFIQWLVRATFGCRSWMPLFVTGNCGVFELVVEPVPSRGSAYLLWKRINFQAVPSEVKALF